MGEKWKLVLPVPLDDGIDHLVLEEDSMQTGGFFVYYLNSVDLSTGGDEWYENFGNALSVATEFGLSASDWQPIELD
ncbi:hypothetical protein [Hymenobacter gelipurpurascens]|nr:hypothetical protein [Hymenobacter gelipurpurascens]